MAAPVSSSTSRMAQAGRVSRLAGLPLGQDQSPYVGRWMRRTSRAPSRTRQGRAPAASIIFIASGPLAFHQERLQVTQGGAVVVGVHSHPPHALVWVVAQVPGG